MEEHDCKTCPGPVPYAWQLKVSETLGELVNETKGLREAVTRQNGNVARVMERVGALEQKQAACEAADKADDRATAPWKRWAEKLITATATALLVLVLLNAPHFLKVLTP